MLSSISRHLTRGPLVSWSRAMASNLNRPAPPPLPREQQREFEELVRKAQSTPEQELHPDARPPVQPAFEGDVNPRTGERGGPKQEPVKRYTEDEGGDWSFKGRVSDF